MKNQLNENIKNYIDKNPTRLHMPGHKGRVEKEYFYTSDVTELSFNDNLLSPNDVILRLNEYIKDTFKSKKSFILVGGSTSGIISSILYSLNKNDKILFPRNSHISSYYGLFLSGGIPVYIYPKDNILGITEEEYINAVKENPDIKAVIITYPSYFGFSMDIEKVCDEIKKINKEIIIIVDEAHGTHFSFCDEYPNTSLRTNSDIVITSMHKTLTALTQTSLLHVNSDLIDINKLKLYINMTTSTSPSYLFLTSVEEAVHLAEDRGDEILKDIKKWYIKTKDYVESNTKFTFEEFSGKIHDYTKICIDTSNSDLDGYTLSEILEKKYNIFTECSTDKYTLCYLGLKTDEDDLEKLKKALTFIAEEKFKIKKRSDIVFENNKPIIKYSMRNALKMNRESVKLDEAANKVSIDYIVPYPPGFPILTPGEVIDNDIISYLKSIMDRQTVLGLNNGYIDVIKE
ncbi:Orn/Lys/Arg decarboxylase, major domain protein [Anaerofustis stercorihominis DSM 17244]|uniref:Orn/Lys/Arg decarboxylase, major domain protein n=1 Tax=Anaerofustis stercorihominis DSM 17244 TaxID=445971 RepID=B1CBF5_9FIRM|nr:aminotransferase class I/II-fold pyridoxal phosphate-dependent enzyme [Anaerofustis stercorihominis]EDS71602.1 Orn/Lys/Arg decarboxylase, major domain protein [Anaerofustis stercorihominis DSM 17244]